MSTDLLHELEALVASVEEHEIEPEQFGPVAEDIEGELVALDEAAGKRPELFWRGEWMNLPRMGGGR